ncbi:unnamed protein product [Larinioides sclopetarius]|uniref:Uncharacterized protein n=1 Tax=Larinioides sclopetarius TaxID=280406 RepID=A0AAV1Z8D4_9ARAC
MYFSICFLVVLTLASIPCDAKFAGLKGFGKFGGNDEGFEGMGGLEGMFGIEETGNQEGDMGEMGMGEMGMGMGKIGNWAPMIPTDEERKMCEAEADNKQQKLVNTFKVPKKTCEVVCQMDNGEKSVLMSPEGTRCCDIVGVGATGKCNGSGRCLVLMF